MMQIRNKLFIFWAFIILFSYNMVAQTVSWKIKPYYTSAEIWNENIIRVSDGAQYGLIRFDGTEILPCEYETIADYCEGYSVVLNSDKLVAVVDSKGKVTDLSSKNYSVSKDYPYFSEGVLPVMNETGRWGYINHNGTPVIDFRYYSALPFSHGVASVRYPDSKKGGGGYFTHIDSKGNIRHLNLSQFKSTDKIIFASSFSKTEKGLPVALVLISDTWAFRDPNGNKVGGITFKGIPLRLEKNMKIASNYELKFNDRWELVSYKDLKGNQELIFTSSHELNKRVSPTSQYISCGVNKNEVIYNGNTFLSTTFEEVLPLNSSFALVKQSGKYGVMEVNPSGKISVELPEYIEVQHHTPIDVQMKLKATNNISDGGFNVRVYDASGKLIAESSNTDVNFQIFPDELDEEFSQELQVELSTGGIKYSQILRNISFKYKPALRISVPHYYKLDADGNAKITITISNESDMPSDKCTVSFDGESRTVESIPANGKRSVSYGRNINVGDSDKKSCSYNVRVKENGCPQQNFNRTITFERHYSDEN